MALEQESIKKHTTGLVLEGGSLRGIFTSGVLDRFLEAGISFDYCVGSSSGACNLLGFLARQPGYIRDCLVQKDNSDSFYGFNQLVTSGRFINLDKLFFEYPNKQLPFRFDDFFASRIDYEFVVTNCHTGKAEYLTERKDPHRLAAIAKASSSLPLFTGMTEYEGAHYLDGTLSDAIPIKRAFDQGCDQVVVILTGREGFSPSFPTYQKLLYEGFYMKYPELIKTIESQKERYQKALDLIDREQKNGRVFLIRPTVPEIRKMESDYDKLKAHYQHGRSTADRLLPALNEFLNQPKGIQ